MTSRRSNYPYGIEPPAKERAIGWTHAKMVRFIELLHEVPNVTQACRLVGMSKESAYKQRRRWPSFAKAWDEAAFGGALSLYDDLFKRARYGSEEPIFHEGRQVGTRRRYHDVLAMLLLRAHGDGLWGEHPINDGSALMGAYIARSGRCRICSRFECENPDCAAQFEAERKADNRARRARYRY